MGQIRRMLDPRKMKQLMKQMDMKDISASEVVIKTASGDIVIRRPKVTKMNMMGQESYQVVGKGEARGTPTEEAADQKAGEDDIKLVQQQTGATEEEAAEALANANGDIAGAILALKR